MLRGKTGGGGRGVGRKRGKEILPEGKKEDKEGKGNRAKSGGVREVL